MAITSLPRAEAVVHVRLARPASCLIALASVLAACLAAAPGAAQAASAPAPSPENTSLYAHRSTSGSDESQGWMNTLVNDGDDNAMGPSASCGPQGAGQVGVGTVDDQLTTTAIDITYKLALAPALAGTLILDAAKGAQATVFFGAGSCQGNVHIVSSLAAAGTTVATGEKDHSYKKGAPYPSVAIPMPITQATLSGALVWTVHVTGKTEGAGYMGISDAQGHTVLALPILSASGGAAAVEQTTSGDASLHIALHAANATTLHRHVNWTASPAAATLAFLGTVANGTASLQVRDASNATLATKSLPGNTTGLALAGKPGTWTLWLNLTAFRGDLDLTLGPSGTSTGTSTGRSGLTGTHTGSSGSGSGSSSHSGTGTSTSSTSKGTPGPAGFIVAGLLATTALVLRRRGA